MAWQSSGRTHEELINNLHKNKVILSERVKNAMMAVDRGYFAKSDAYEDRPLSIGYGATISAPHMVGINNFRLFSSLPSFWPLYMPFGTGVFLCDVGRMASVASVSTDAVFLADDASHKIPQVVAHDLFRRSLNTDKHLNALLL
ncbi:unnamed protein product [Echinostoma caproni]|uniref:protein-L-isoaspartate(D-aspartate) O-methyltransferase n=1 Tax=Echinostoma caproni TaxID=27848 RepID=A0A183BEJ2_9TREM|nr:unnamed protein product [Echinostoma caproni]